MMNLIQETEISKKKNRYSLSIILVTVIAVALGYWFTVVSSMGISGGSLLFDSPTLLGMSVVTVLFILGTNLGRPFLQAFLIVTEKKKTPSEKELVRAKSAVRLASSAWLGMGILESCVGFMAIGLTNIDVSLLVENLNITIPVALLGILYGLTGFLLLLPIRTKLESMCSAGAAAEE